MKQKEKNLPGIFDVTTHRSDWLATVKIENLSDFLLACSRWNIAQNYRATITPLDICADSIINQCHSGTFESLTNY